MKRKILISGPVIADEAMQLLEARNIEAIMIPPYTESNVIADLAKKEQIDAILVRMGDINETVIRASDKLRVIAKHGVGVNNIDVLAATKHNIPVMITRAANARSVSEHTLTMIFALMKSLPRLDAGLREGKWEKTTFKGIEVSEKILGIIGFGSIGRDLATLVEPLNMRILIFDPLLAEDDIPAGVVRMDDLDMLLREADVVSLHCPLTELTRDMIGIDQFKMMKPSAFLINAARGELIDEAALVKALRDGVIAGAGLDSFAKEPPETDNPLWALPNVLVTPHVAAVTTEAFRRMGMQAAKNILSILDNENVDRSCILNAEVL